MEYKVVKINTDLICKNVGENYLFVTMFDKEVFKKLSFKKSRATHPCQINKIVKEADIKTKKSRVTHPCQITNKVLEEAIVQYIKIKNQKSRATHPCQIIIKIKNQNNIYYRLRHTMSVGEYGYSYKSTSSCIWPTLPPSTCHWRPAARGTSPASTRSTTPPPCAIWSSLGLTNNKLFKIINGNQARGYNLGIWNCRRGLITGNGLPSTKLEEIKLFLVKKNLHMLCIIETDLHSYMSRSKRRVVVTKKDIESSLGILGYKIYLPATWKQHGQTRILVYAREELKVKQKVLEAALSDLPMLTFEIGFGNERKTIVNFFYREFTNGVTSLNTAQDQMERLGRMIGHWRSLASSKKDLVCLGDANLCAMKWNNDDYYLKDLSESVQTFLLETNCDQLVRSYTRSEIGQGGTVSRSCIDHCYTDACGKVSTPEVSVVGNSDHLGVSVTKYTRALIRRPRVIKKRSYKNFRKEDFLRDIQESNINAAVTAHNNIEDAAHEFEKSFKNVLDKHAPIKVFQMRKNYSSYISDSTKKIIEERNAWKELAVNNKYRTAERFSKELGKEIKKAITNDRRDYFNKDFGENCDRSNAWKTARVILGQNNNLLPTEIKNIDANGCHEQVTNPERLAELFNNFFKKKVDRLREKTDQQPTIPPEVRLQEWLSKRSCPPPPFELKEIENEELRRILKRMKAKRTHGTDWIDSNSLKLAGPLIEESLLYLINLSIRENTFARKWKPQMIFPHHKKGKLDVMENFRPVSHLVQVGIMVEYAAYFQIVEHFTRYDLFHPNHHGSITNHSTATAIAQLFDTLLEASERQELSAVCLLDQSAAYDLLCHQTLRKKLELYNFTDPTIDWLMSYLGGRTQQVQIEAKISTPLSGGDHAVPQGSILGGLLHVINSNDFPACHEEGSSVVYVDDDSDIVSAKDPEVLRDSIEHEAGNSAQWLADNRLCVAGSKSKLLVIGTEKLKKMKNVGETKIIVDGKVIPATSSEKLLGVVLNNSLTWKHHLYGDAVHEGLIQQLSKRLGMLKMMSKYMERKNLSFFASGMFYSKLIYCLPVYGNVFGLDEYREDVSRYQSFTKKDNQKLQVLQNNLNRLLLGAKRDTSTEVLLGGTNSLSIQQMIAYHTMLLAHKVVTTGKPSYLKERLQVKTGPMNLRGKQGNITLQNKKLSISREGFAYRGAALLNKLDDDLRNEINVKTFKVGLRRWVLSNIAVKPKRGYIQFQRKKVLRPVTPVRRNGQDIRNFLIDRSSSTGQEQQRCSSPPQPTDRPPPGGQQGILSFFSPVCDTQYSDNVVSGKDVTS